MRPILPMLLAAAVVATAAAADAATITKLATSTGTAACSPALPAFEGVIRKRPLAIQNEGDASAFISCSMTTVVSTGLASATNAYLGLYNNAAAQLSVTCTLVAGVPGAFTTGYSTKTINVNPSSWAELNWTPGDIAPTALVMSPNVSCNLPPGIGITYAGSRYQDEIGD